MVLRLQVLLLGVERRGTVDSRGRMDIGAWDVWRG